jgi:homoserine kinase
MPLTHGYHENSRGIGVADMAHAIRSGRPHRCDASLAFHALEVMQAAERAGALASSISGSGPSIFAMCHGPQVARRVGHAMQQAFRRAGLESSLLISAADCPGATRC